MKMCQKMYFKTSTKADPSPALLSWWIFSDIFRRKREKPIYQGNWKPFFLMLPPPPPPPFTTVVSEVRTQRHFCKRKQAKIREHIMPSQLSLSNKGILRFIAYVLPPSCLRPILNSLLLPIGKKERNRRHVSCYHYHDQIFILERERGKGKIDRRKARVFSKNSTRLIMNGKQNTASLHS